MYEDRQRTFWYETLGVNDPTSQMTSWRLKRGLEQPWRLLDNLIIYLYIFCAINNMLLWRSGSASFLYQIFHGFVMLESPCECRGFEPLQEHNFLHVLWVNQIPYVYTSWRVTSWVIYHQGWVPYHPCSPGAVAKAAASGRASSERGADFWTLNRRMLG